MNWFLIALAAPALWSATNHIDKYLIAKYFQGLHLGALVLFSTLAGLFILPFIFIFHPDIFNIGIKNALLIMSISILALSQLYTYFYAISREEASIVVPLFQTIPIFAYILGYIFLGETLTLTQIFASLLILAGAVIISLDLSEKKPKLKKSVFWTMMLSSFLVALSGLIFKIVAIQNDFLTTAFWAYVGDALVGIFILTFIKNYRTQFLGVFKKNKLPVISINVLNEAMNAAANMCIKYASLLAPLALVWIVNGFQPFFVLLFGVLLTLFFPNLGKESLTRRHLAQKLIAIIIMFIGVYILNI